MHKCTKNCLKNLKIMFCHKNPEGSSEKRNSPGTDCDFESSFVSVVHGFPWVMEVKPQKLNFSPF